MSTTVRIADEFTISCPPAQVFAYMVDPEWQGVGLGGILHRGLVDYARQHGARGLTADVLIGNSPMMRIFERGDYTLTSKTSEGVSELTMLFRD